VNTSSKWDIHVYSWPTPALKVREILFYSWSTQALKGRTKNTKGGATPPPFPFLRGEQKKLRPALQGRSCATPPPFPFYHLERTPMLYLIDSIRSHTKI